MLSIIGIKKTIKQHTADMDITDSVDYKISAPPRFYNVSTSSVIRCDQLRNKSSRRVTYGNPCYSIGSKANSIYFLNDHSV
jgi:hypothetical protein